MVRGQSLTPREREQEVNALGIESGIMSAACALLPSSMGVYFGMKRSPTFLKYTNWQSRTALVIMPPLFMFSLAGEQKINHKMRQMAAEKDHANEVSQWSQKNMKLSKHDSSSSTTSLINNVNKNDKTSNPDEERMKTLSEKLDAKVENMSEEERSKQLVELYRKSVENSGVRIVPGNSLGIHHKFANFWQENPFKMLTALSVPTIVYIFKGKTGQKHLQLQSMIMHTRVYGQGAVLIMLLTLMGFKAYMDSEGSFITEHEAQYRILEMKLAREKLLERLEQDKKNLKYMNQLQIKAKEEIRAMRKNKKERVE